MEYDPRTLPVLVDGSRELSETDRQRKPQETEELKEIAKRIRVSYEHARKSSQASLEHFRDVGRMLNDAREVCRRSKKRDFTSWVQSELGYSRQWSRKLRKLADEWSMLAPAAAWAQADGTQLDLSVKDALRMVAQYRGTQEPKAQEDEFGNAGAAALDRAFVAPTPDAIEEEAPPPSQETEHEKRLSAKLAIANHRIDQLVEEVAKLKTKLAIAKLFPEKRWSGVSGWRLHKGRT